jgi:hypothetical protein
MSPTVVEIEVSLVVRDSSAALRRDQVAEDKAMAK